MDAASTAGQRATRVGNLLDMLGLTHVKDTIVGDEMLRGISGGQRWLCVHRGVAVG